MARAASRMGWANKISSILDRDISNFSAARPESSLNQVRGILLGDSSLRSDWHVLLDQAEISGIPVLNGDVAALIEKAKKETAVWR
jgi:hypothetical protein